MVLTSLRRLPVLLVATVVVVAAFVAGRWSAPRTQVAVASPPTSGEPPSSVSDARRAPASLRERARDADGSHAQAGETDGTLRSSGSSPSRSSPRHNSPSRHTDDEAEPGAAADEVPASTGDGDSSVEAHGAVSAGCALVGAIRSQSSKTPTTITIDNPSDAAVGVAWLDFGGALQERGAIAAGESQTFDTYLTHPWIVTDERGDCVEVLLPQSDYRKVDIAGGFPIACEGADDLRSKQTTTSLWLDFENTLDADVTLYWLGYDGEKKQTLVVPAGETRGLRTFVGHPWLAERDGTCHGVYVPFG